MIWKRIAGSYKHSHQKTTKSFEKALDIKHRIGQNSPLHRFTASPLHRFTASPLHSFTAEGKLCPNKFKYQLLKPCSKIGSPSKTDCLPLGFFHTPFKKPQGTQSVELRSTSQRIIKECLTKPS
ncbi:hypothetical protein [Treponema putidum]|uniref:hypothetical protein n=1 Tax=Treponema putidum TaxID=221027 RepID=UPI0021061EC0|nr:hypothetical protein [Treponema putidum]UTY31893.1 hypothetical protein E4N75_10690 [Treponema putidum]